MNISRLRILLVVLSMISAAVSSYAYKAPVDPGKPDFDIRFPLDKDQWGGFVLRVPATEQLIWADQLAQSVPGLVLRWDGMSASPKWLAAPPGYALSPSSAGKADEIARGFIRSHAGLYGLTHQDIDMLEVTSIVPLEEGGANVYFKQRVNRLEVYGGRANISVRADGAVPFAGSSLYARIDHRAAPLIVSTEAVRIAVQDVYPGLLFGEQLLSMEKDGEMRAVFDGRGFGRPPEVRLVLFPERDGARLAWEVKIAEQTLETDYRILVDSLSGEILFRRNMTRYANARVLNAGAPNPETEEYQPVQYQMQTIPPVTPESPSGWISGTGTSLTGNNAASHMLYWTLAGLSETSATYDYPYNNGSAVLVNSWWWANDAHDRFYAYGFNEAAGNYQVDNFGLGGTGSDPMHIVSWGEAGRDNAFYTGSIDGGTSTLNMFWVGCTYCGDHDEYPENKGERSTGFMRDVIVHEYTHGVTTRMVGGPAAEDCLYGIQSGAMGEGWSDAFPASFYGDPKTGGHFFEGSGWMRDPRHDVGYAQLCDVGNYECEVHDDGMIWAGALWDLRQSMIALDPASGLDAFHRILVRGLANLACYPDMIDARDAILTADTALYASSHHGIIWNVFARRGMGEGASSTGENDITPVKSTTVPVAYTCTAPAAPTGLTVTPIGSNALTLSYSAAGASAVEIWRDDLSNSLDTYARIASTTNLSNYLDNTVQGGKNYSYYLVALGGGGIYCRSSASGSASGTATGTCSSYPVFEPQLSIADGASNCSLTLSWNHASQGCPGAGAPITYNIYRATTPGYEPSEKLMIGRTTATTFNDTPPADGRVYYYLILAQHGMLNDPADHGDRGTSQILTWVPRIPTLGRTTYQYWNFEAGAAGWTATNSNDPSGGWTLVDPISTKYADVLLAPETAAGGSGKAWVTGDTGAVPATITSSDSDGEVLLQSPSFDGTGGRTILSFDYWAHIPGNFYGGLDVEVTNGTNTVRRTIIGFMTVQAFETSSARSWQRAEIDLSSLVAPSATMRVTFITNPSGAFSEFGVDNVRIEQAAVCSRSGLRINSMTVQDGNPGWGNGNGVLESGETARIVVMLRNDGTTTSVAPQGRLVAASPGVLIHDDSSSFPDITVGGTGSSSGPGFTVTVPDSACGGTLEFRFEFTDSSGAGSRERWTLEYGRTVTDTVFSDDFETDKGWTPFGPGTGKGVWQRGDPVGTMDGSNQANPENDSPNDAGSNCFVTENGPVGGDPNANDVDNQYSELYSPYVDLTNYKRARLKFDLWYYDNSSSDYWQDYGYYLAFVDDGLLWYYWNLWYNGAATGGWSPKNIDLTGTVPMVADVMLYFGVIDRDSTFYYGATDSIVEMGIDNVKVEGDWKECIASGVTKMPSGIGNTLRVSKSGSNASIAWTASPVDVNHDGAAYYRLYVSSSKKNGFAVKDSTTLTSGTRPLSGTDEYYKITAVNDAGTSGDEPTP